MGKVKNSCIAVPQEHTIVAQSHTFGVVVRLMDAAREFVDARGGYAEYT